MDWECLKCGTVNDRFDQTCGGCQLDKDRAISLITKLLTSCEEVRKMITT